MSIILTSGCNGTNPVFFTLLFSFLCDLTPTFGFASHAGYDGPLGACTCHSNCCCTCCAFCRSDLRCFANSCCAACSCCRALPTSASALRACPSASASLCRAQPRTRLLAFSCCFDCCTCDCRCTSACRTCCAICCRCAAALRSASASLRLALASATVAHGAGYSPRCTASCAACIFRLAACAACLACLTLLRRAYFAFASSLSCLRGAPSRTTCDQLGCSCCCPASLAALTSALAIICITKIFALSAPCRPTILTIQSCIVASHSTARCSWLPHL